MGASGEGEDSWRAANPPFAAWLSLEETNVPS